MECGVCHTIHVKCIPGLSEGKAFHSPAPFHFLGCSFFSFCWLSLLNPYRTVMVNLHSQFGWALTCHGDTPRGMSVMVFQSSSAKEGRPKLNMGWHHLTGCSFTWTKKGSKRKLTHHLHSPLLPDCGRDVTATASSHRHAFPATMDVYPETVN